MPAQRVYRFDYIAPNSQAELFNHGWDVTDAVNYSIVVYAGSGPGVPFPVGHATVTEGETRMHVNGTVGRHVYIRNNAPFNSCTVDVLAQWQQA